MAPNSDQGYNLSSGFLRYPPSRKNAIKSAYNWLKGKAQTDQVGDFWRVHDKLYDLTNFISKHPGGKFWIEEARGCDVTESFESSHFGEVPYKLLESYYVKEADWPRNSPFTFHQEDFFMTLKRKATPIILKEARGIGLESYLIQDGLLVFFLTCLILGGWYQSRLLLIAAGISLGMAALASHNFFHQRDNWRMYIFDALLVSSNEWRISHAMSHHNFPNTIYDYEIEAFEPFLIFLPNKDKPYWLNYAIYLIFPLMIMLSFYFDTFRRILITRKNGWQTLLPFIQLTYLVILSPTLVEGIINCLILHCSASMYFLGVALAGTHHHPDIFREGDKLPESRDWGLLQVFATRDMGYGINSTFLSAISFGNHTLHHLFPTVDMSKLYLLMDPFLETCDEFGIEFKLMPVWDSFKGTFKSLLAKESNQNLPDVIKVKGKIQ